MEPIRKKPRSPLSPIQKKRLVAAGICLLLISLLWLFFAPNMGIYSVLHKRSTLIRLKEQNAQIEKKNESLKKDIDQIKNDPHYLEKVARDKYGLLKENEMIFDFSPNKKEKKK